MKPAPTERQGQFLAYIHQYSLLNGCAPAEADMQRFFQITPPSVHSIVLTLERRGFIQRERGEARKAIRDYRKATRNVSGTVELLMTYVENGTRFTHEYGDIDERFYSSVESALDELATLLRGEAREIYPQFSDRLVKVEKMTEGIGWGFHDFVADVVGRLGEELGDS